MKKNPTIQLIGNSPDEKIRIYLRQYFEKIRAKNIDTIEKRAQKKLPKTAEEYGFAVEYFSDRIEGLVNYVAQTDWVDPTMCKMTKLRL